MKKISLYVCSLLLVVSLYPFVVPQRADASVLLQCDILSFTADDTFLLSGQTTNLRFAFDGQFHWRIDTISGNGTSSPAVGYSNFGITAGGLQTQTTTYKLTCGPTVGLDVYTDIAYVTIAVPSAPVCTASPSTITSGETVTFTAYGGNQGQYSWSIPNGSPSSGVGLNFASTFYNTGTTSVTRTATVTNDGVSSNCQVTVNPPAVVTPTCTLSANPTTGMPPYTSTLTWTATDAATCTATGAWSTSGSTSRNPAGGSQDYTVTGGGGYTHGMTCTNAAGTASGSCSASITGSAATATVSATKNSCATGGGNYDVTVVATGGEFILKIMNGSGVVSNLTGVESATSISGRVYSGIVPVTDNNTFQVVDVASGVVLASYNVGTTGCMGGGGVNNSTPPTITLTSTSTSIEYGGSVTVNWTTVNATDCSIDGEVVASNQIASGSKTFTNVTTSGTKHINMICYNGSGGGQRIKTLSLPVVSHAFVDTPAFASPGLNIKPSATTVALGSPVKLWWSTNNVTSCVAGWDWSGNKPVGTNQSEIVVTTMNTTQYYSLNCTGPYGPVTRTATVQVTSSSPLPTIDFAATPSSVNTSSQSVTLYWTVANATYCQFLGGAGDWTSTPSTTFNSSKTVSNLTTSPYTHFTITCYNNAGQSVSRTISIAVSAPGGPPSIEFFTTPASVSDSSTGVTVYWRVQNGVTCTAGGDAPWGSQGNITFNDTTWSNYYVGTINATKNYSITCTNASGSATRWASTYYNPPAGPAVNAPVVSLSATPSSGTPPLTSFLSWSVTNSPTSCVGENGVAGWPGTKSASGNQTVANITDPTTFSLRCSNAGGENIGSVVVSPTVASSGNLLVTNFQGGVVESVPAGDIDCGMGNILCSKNYDAGTTIILQATPESTQWSFVGWQGACRGSGQCEVFIRGGGQTETVTPIFNVKPLLFQEI